ncbi:hypothetical protein Danklef1_60 [Polaribacter phage Danklef_1]|uniref:Uncharacterized protein n=1 Tax=Polaribacter phage Danklef_1 TaxID=2745646 RepID=A0A8E4ZL64_9CAUD|nr:hypothetical protein M1M23_gp60 [Polaribacter phage Danklef_1]QQV90620.1 hypothetical protein Danklef2_60 [Polaribacter phage Danklef_2]QQV90697.1 hypothetical protein Danklef3_61 [Polaribacter phage Danklef_3]QQV90774.1 hypothetical protein Danklef4_61 [Polaribacter phage Danklef_4]QQV90852.1 hypothetical protein Danklef5_62 [Polaribacter phage Danklef_5]QQV90544.1 hypothetical protein Danklef1_60 [Polaribacter phage Danklef_1]
MQDKILKLLESKTESCKGTSDVIYYEQLESLAEELNSLFSLQGVMSRLPESDEIKQQAQLMDEKEFDQWWWENVYKVN